MSLCNINVHNEADLPLAFVCQAGDFWQNIPPQGEVIQPGQDTGPRFAMGGPGLFGNNHWGWLYFRFDVPGIGSKMFLIYLEMSNSISSDKYGVGPCMDTNSASRDNPFPQGQFGVTKKDQDDTIHVTIFNKDLLSTELSPESWMGDIARLRPSVLDWPLSRFKYPGQHDAGSFGNKQHSQYPTAWSWQCSDKNFYQQACSGIRWFDLRLSKTGSYYWPYHGYSEKTGDPLSWGTGDPSFSARPEDTLIGQILQFIKEHPSEILMVHIKFKGGPSAVDGWTAIHKYLKNYLLPPPSNNITPTLRSISGQNRRIIVFSDTHQFKSQEDLAMLDYIWDSRNRNLWRGSVWNQRDWDRDDMSLVVKATEAWMREHIKPTGPPIFWWAQCQLTPSFMHPDFFLYPSRSPKVLARHANPYTRQYITNRDMYKQNGSVFSMDWASDDENLAIAAMNLDTDGSTGPWDEQSTHTALPTAFQARIPHSHALSQPPQMVTTSERSKHSPITPLPDRLVRLLKSPKEDIDADYDEIDAIKEKKRSMRCCW